MPERTITVGFFAYKGEKHGKPRAFRAWQGDTVNLSDAEAARGDAIGAFEPVGVTERVAPTERASTEERAQDPFSVEWLEASTAATILDAVAGDPDMAASMASIEEHRPKPRTTLIRDLRKVRKD